MNQTKIEWCDKTLNPVVGCSYGCPYCYARRINTRFRYVPDFSEPQFFPERLEQLKSKKTRESVPRLYERSGGLEADVGRRRPGRDRGKSTA